MCVPSSDDYNSILEQTIILEDKVGIADWKKRGAVGLDQARPMPRPPPTREELTKFMESEAVRSADWKRLLSSDAQAAAAMQTVRRRIDELLANGRRQVHQQTLIPDSGYHVLNRRIGERPNPFLTSKLNPLEATELTKGYDPRAREWTGRQGLVGLPKEQTSFWCESFGMSSSDKAIDQDFKHAMEPKGDPQAAAGLHSRAWRV